MKAFRRRIVIDVAAIMNDPLIGLPDAGIGQRLDGLGRVLQGSTLRRVAIQVFLPVGGET